MIAADDSVMAQTIEAINHARAAGCPTIIAVNKCDKDGADPTQLETIFYNMRLLQKICGEVLCVDVSALTERASTSWKRQ